LHRRHARIEMPSACRGVALSPHNILSELRAHARSLCAGVYAGFAVEQTSVRQGHPTLPSDGEIILQDHRRLTAGHRSTDYRLHAPPFTGICRLVVA